MVFLHFIENSIEQTRHSVHYAVHNAIILYEPGQCRDDRIHGCFYSCRAL